jgi:hypothetical protein
MDRNMSDPQDKTATSCSFRSSSRDILSNHNFSFTSLKHFSAGLVLVALNPSQTCASGEGDAAEASLGERIPCTLVRFFF